MSNEFLPFGNSGGANVMSQGDYQALAARVNGFSSGTANSAQLNKVWRQSALMSAMLGQFISDHGQNALDDGSVSNLLVAFSAALNGVIQSVVGGYGVGGGTANAQTATFPSEPTALVDGIILRYKASVANTGACTFNANSLGAKPIVGGGYAALQGGEIVANGEVWLQYNTSIGSGSWVLVICSGGSLQIAQATQAKHALQVGQAGHGQCRIGFVSATSIRLSPYNGNNLIIDGIPQQIPGAGVSISNSGLSASTLYYIYAYMNSGVMALDISTIGHSTHTNGVEIKTGDSSRTLVGMVYVNASSQFADSQTARHVANWFNRRSVGGTLSRTTTINFTNVGTMAEVSTGDRVSFLSWVGESTEIKALGQYVGGAAGQSVSVQCYVDGAAYANNSASYVPVANSGIVFCSGSSFSISGSPLSEGQHIAQVYSGLGNGASGGAITALANSVMTRI